jgi:hypothetical protein
VLLSRSSAVTDFFTAATNLLQPTIGILFVYVSRVTNSDQSKGIEETAAERQRETEIEWRAARNSTGWSGGNWLAVDRPK